MKLDRLTHLDITHARSENILELAGSLEGLQAITLSRTQLTPAEQAELETLMPGRVAWWEERVRHDVR